MGAAAPSPFPGGGGGGGPVPPLPRPRGSRPRVGPPVPAGRGAPPSAVPTPAPRSRGCAGTGRASRRHRTATAPPPHRTAPLRGPSGSRGGGGDGTGRVLARRGRGATVRGGQRATEGCSCTGLLGGGTGEREGERAWAHPRVGARPRVHVSAARRSTHRARGCPQETAPTAARIRRTWPRPNAGRGPGVAVSRPDGAVRRTPPASKMAAAALSPPARPHRMFAARRAETGPSGMRSPTARFRAPAAAPPPGAGGPGR